MRDGFERVRFRQDHWGLDKVLFDVQPPEPQYQSQVFAGRDQELERAATLLWDAPQNILLSGLQGMGKTLFIRELLRSVQEYDPITMLGIYGCLDMAKTDLPTTILCLLARMLSEEDDRAKDLAHILEDIEITVRSTHKGGGGVEAGVPGFFKAGGTKETVEEETHGRKTVGNPLEHIRELVRRAIEREPARRLIVAVDDLDKLDPATARKLLVEARSILHTDCAFVFTGHPVHVLRDIYSTAGAVFGTVLHLEVLPSDDLRTIMVNYLNAGRRQDGPIGTLHPFTNDAADMIIQRSFGVPRLLNKIARHILDKAAELRCREVDLSALQKCWRSVGGELKRTMTVEMAVLHDLLKEQTGDFDPKNVPDAVYGRLGVDSHEMLFARFNNAMSEDLVVGIEVHGRTHFRLQPLLETLPALLPAADDKDETDPVDTSPEEA